MARERDEAGRYVPSGNAEDVLDVFDTVEGPVIGSPDVADALDITTEAARQKLRALDGDELRSRTIGRTVVYWRGE
jgi:hypothetical protein